MLLCFSLNKSFDLSSLPKLDFKSEINYQIRADLDQDVFTVLIIIIIVGIVSLFYFEI